MVYVVVVVLWPVVEQRRLVRSHVETSTDFLHYIYRLHRNGMVECDAIYIPSLFLDKYP